MLNRPEKLDREAMLTLYSAGELPEEQKQRVEKMLAGEQSLKAELAQILDAQALLNRELASVDQLDPLPVSASAAVRAVSRELRQRHTDELARPMKVAPGPHRRWLVMLYPAGVAAAVLAFGIYKWSGVQDFPSNPVSQNTDEGNDFEANRRFARVLFPEVDRESSELDAVEDQLMTLAEWSKPIQ